MKRLFILLFAALLTSSLLSSCVTDVVDETVQIESVQDAASFTALKVNRSSDNISVTGWSRDSIIAKANLSIWANSTDNAKQIGEDLQFSWATGSTTAELLVTSDVAGQELAYLREMVISTPSRFALNLETGSGDIKATNMAGDLNLITGSGSITADTKGKIIASTSSGDVNAICGQGASLDLGSGDVALDVTSSAFDDVTISTSSGDVSLRLADSAQVTFDLSTSSGDIDINYGGTSTVTENGYLRIDVNGGGKLITIETSSGNIKVRAIH